MNKENFEKLICSPEFVESEKPDLRIIKIADKYGLADKEFNQLKVNINQAEEIQEKLVINI